MSASSPEEPSKQLLPYLQRADELQKHEPLVAYYCRLYAALKLSEIPAKEQTSFSKDLFVSLINQLEKDKKVLNVNATENPLHVEGFALNVFAKADKQDRAGRADLATAKTFYAAGIFFDVCRQFGDLSPELEQKQKYAVWKAADIRKALKEGRQPIAGPPGGDEDTLTQQQQQQPPQEGADFTARGGDRPGAAPSALGDMAGQFPMAASAPSPPLPQFPSQPPPPGYAGLSSSSSAPSFQSSQAHPLPAASGSDGINGLPSVPSIPPKPSAFTRPTFPTPGSQYSSEVLPGLPSVPSAPLAPPAHTRHPSAPAAPPPSSAPSGTHVPHPSSPLNLLPTAAAAAIPPASRIGPSILSTDSSFSPTPDRIAEAHKAARFAVSALAFDDAPTAISYLQHSLEILTNPYARV